MIRDNRMYSIEPVKPFPVNGARGNYYIIDLPPGSWGEEVAVVKLDHSGLYQHHLPQHLQEGDLLRLPNGSWLEVSIGDNCFGYDGSKYGLLHLMKENHDREIIDIKERQTFFRTIASLIC